MKKIVLIITMLVVSTSIFAQLDNSKFNRLGMSYRWPYGWFDKDLYVGSYGNKVLTKTDFKKDTLISQIPQFDYAKNIFGTEYLIALHNTIAAGTATEIWFGGTSQIIYHEPTGSPVNVVKALAERNGFNANITFYNGAVGGSSTEDFILNKLSEIQSRQPKAVVISHEINDGSKNVTLSNRLGIYERRMDTILSALRNGGNGISTGKDVTQLSIVLVTSSATNDYLYNRDSAWYIQANLVLRKMARKYKCAFVDTWNFLNDANSTWMDAPFPSNPEIGIHPTPVANRWIGGMIYDALFPKGLETYAAANSLPTFFQLANISGNDSLKSVSASPHSYIYGISLHRTTDAPYNGSLYTLRHKDNISLQFNVGYSTGSILVRSGWDNTWYGWKPLEEINNPSGTDTIKSVTASPANYPYGVSLHRSTNAPLDGALFTQRQKDNISVQINSGYLDGRTSIRTGWGSTWYKWYKLDSLGINPYYQLVNAVSSDSLKSVTASTNSYVLGSSFHRTTDAPYNGALFTYRQRDFVNLQTNVGFADGKIAIRGGWNGNWYRWYHLDSLLANPLTTTGDIVYSSTGSTAARLPIGTSNQVLTVSGGVPTWQNAPSSGTYTPTFSNLNNVASVTNVSAKYMVIGNICTVNILATTQPLASSAMTTFSFTLPFTKAGVNTGNGNGQFDIDGQNTISILDGAGNTANCGLVPLNTNSAPVSLTFTYIITPFTYIITP